MTKYSQYDDLGIKYQNDCSLFMENHKYEWEIFLEQENTLDLDTIYDYVTHIISLYIDAHDNPFIALTQVTEAFGIHRIIGSSSRTLESFEQLNILLKHQCILSAFHTLLEIISKNTYVSLSDLVFSLKGYGLNYLIENNLISYTELIANAQDNQTHILKITDERSTLIPEDYAVYKNRINYISKSTILSEILGLHVENGKNYFNILGSDLAYKLLTMDEKLNIDARIEKVNNILLNLKQLLTASDKTPQGTTYLLRFLSDLAKYSYKIQPNGNLSDNLIFLYKKELCLNTDIITKCYNTKYFSSALALHKELCCIFFPFSRIPIIDFILDFNFSPNNEYLEAFIHTLFSIQTSFFIFLIETFKKKYDDTFLPELLTVLNTYLHKNYSNYHGMEKEMQTESIDKAPTERMSTNAARCLLRAINNLYDY